MLLGMLRSEFSCFAKSRVSEVPPLVNLSDAVIGSTECSSQMNCIKGENP